MKILYPPLETLYPCHFHPHPASSLKLKGKLPQSFMQIGWMQDDFRNLTAKVWANLDNPIKRLISLILCMSPSQMALFRYLWCHNSTTVYWKCMKMHLPSSFILRYVRTEMNVHAFMNELDQKDYWYPRKLENYENLRTKSMESCPLVISHVLAQFHPERATYTTLHNHFS